MELLRIIFHAFFILLLVLTRLNELYSINKILKRFVNNAPFSNPYIFKLMKLYTNRLNNPYSYIISFVFMA
ncbi:hypothetical protein EWZ74_01855 [Helicobacter pylori]|nr:hypothetical protein [Helicobacter pylori]